MLLFTLAAAALTRAGPLPSVALPPAGIWPLPKSTSCGAGAGGALSDDVKLTATGAGASSDVVKAALVRYRLILLPSGSGDGDITDVTVAVVSADDTLSDATDFSYSIHATSTAISATAASPFGVAYALESLSQLMDKGKLKCSKLAITDSPRFVHRGLMIGRCPYTRCGRHCFSDHGWLSLSRRHGPPLLPRPVRQVYRRRTVGRCPSTRCMRHPPPDYGWLGLSSQMFRMNVLHFHLSEECFRVESKKFPQLTAPGSCLRGKYNNTAFYTHEDIADLVAYSRLRGVRILPEFDVSELCHAQTYAVRALSADCCHADARALRRFLLDPRISGAEMLW